MQALKSAAATNAGLVGFEPQAHERHGESGGGRGGGRGGGGGAGNTRTRL